MPYRRNGGPYSVDLRPRGYPRRVGPYSTGSTNKADALQAEATIRELALTGQHEALDTLREGRISLPALHAAKVSGRLHALLNGVTDPPLTDAVRDFLRAHDDPRHKRAMAQLLSIAPPGAKVSWLHDPTNIVEVVRHYRETGLSGGTERREMSGVRLLIREHFGKAIATEIWDQIKLRPDSRGRTRWLTRTEIAHLRSHAGDWWIILGFAITTGLRQGEIFALQVKDIDFENGAVVVPAGKTARARRRVPLGGESLKALGDWVVEEGL